MTEVDVARMQELIDALRAFASVWACDQMSASYVANDGALYQLVVGSGYAYVELEDGSRAVLGTRWGLQ
jgi:hypothetical protein